MKRESQASLLLVAFLFSGCAAPRISTQQDLENRLHDAAIPYKSAVLKDHIVSVDLSGLQVTNLAPLAGLPLTVIKMQDCPVRDLEPLVGMPLRELWLQGTRVADLSPLANMPLEYVFLDRTFVTDLRPLSEAPLKFITFDPVTVTNGVNALRDKTSLNRIGVDFPRYFEPTEFWKKYDAGELQKRPNKMPRHIP